MLLFDVNFALSIYFIYPWLMEAKFFAIIIWEIANRLLKTKSIFHIFCNLNHITMFASASFVVSLSSFFVVVFKNFLPCHFVEYWFFCQAIKFSLLICLVLIRLWIAYFNLLFSSFFFLNSMNSYFVFYWIVKLSWLFFNAMLLVACIWYLHHIHVVACIWCFLLDLS